MNETAQAEDLVTWVDYAIDYSHADEVQTVREPEYFGQVVFNTGLLAVRGVMTSFGGQMSPIKSGEVFSGIYANGEAVQRKAMFVVGDLNKSKIYRIFEREDGKPTSRMLESSEIAKLIGWVNDTERDNNGILDLMKLNKVEISRATTDAINASRSTGSAALTTASANHFKPRGGGRHRHLSHLFIPRH